MGPFCLFVCEIMYESVHLCVFDSVWRELSLQGAQWQNVMYMYINIKCQVQRKTLCLRIISFPKLAVKQVAGVIVLI